jgi:23S rRNA C2498 (ribose-2'-O)-methylase RlmM
MYGIHYMDAITHMDENGHMFEIDLIIQWMKCDMVEIAFVRKMTIIHIG